MDIWLKECDVVSHLYIMNLYLSVEHIARSNISRN